VLHHHALTHHSFHLQNDLSGQTSHFSLNIGNKAGAGDEAVWREVAYVDSLSRSDDLAE